MFAPKRGFLDQAGDRVRWKDYADGRMREGAGSSLTGGLWRGDRFLQFPNGHAVECNWVC